MRSFFLTLLSLLTCISWAQTSQTGAITGLVSDNNEDLLPGVTVTATMPDGSFPKTTVTDARGDFTLGFLKPGTYQITFTLSGFKTRTEKGIKVRAGETNLLIIALEPGQVEESLVVTAEIPLIDRDTQEYSTSLGEEAIERLPVTRDVNDLLAFTPGASSNGVYGGSGDEANSYQLDGVSVNSTGFGGDFLQPNINWVKEYQVKGLGAGAEYGNFQGGLINIVTKSGSNTFEGNFHMVYESESLNDSNLTLGEAGAELDHFGEANFDISGAFIKDKLYYFISAEQQRRDLNIVDPIAGQENGEIRFFDVQEERTETKLYGKFTYQASNQDTFNLVIGWDDIETDNRNLDSFTLPSATVTQESPALLYNLSWERVLGNAHFLEVKYTGYDGEDNRLPQNGDIAGVRLLNLDRNDGRNARYTRLRDLTNNTLSVATNSFYNWGGANHHIKMGGEYNQGEWLEQRIRNGNLTWRPEIERSDLANFEDPSTWTFISSDWGGGIRLDAETVNAAIYIQDYITVNDRLDISLGLRYGMWEGKLTPGFSAGGRFTAMDDAALAPRAGITFDLSGDDRWIAKAHYGRYYQSMFALLYDRTLGADAFQDEEYWDWVGEGTPDLNADYNPSNRDDFFEFYDSQPTSSEVGPVENYSQPYVDQLVVGIEHQLNQDWKIGLTYINRENKNILSLVDKNLDTNYTALNNVEVWNFRESRPELDPFGNPLFLETVYIRNDDYNPDYVLTTNDQAFREMDQFQLVIDGYGDRWDFGFSLVNTDLVGNFYTVSGYENGDGTGAGAFVNRNEQTNFVGNIRNQAEWEAKIRFTYDLPMDFRLGGFFRWDSGYTYTPSYSIDTRNNDFYDADGDLLDFSLFESVSGETIFLAPRGSSEYEDLSRLDLRVEKVFRFSNSRLILTVDAFNLFNEDAVTSVKTSVNGQDENQGTTLFGSTRGVQSPRAFQFKTSFRW